MSKEIICKKCKVKFKIYDSMSRVLCQDCWEEYSRDQMLKEKDMYQNEIEWVENADVVGLRSDIAKQSKQTSLF